MKTARFVVVALLAILGLSQHSQALPLKIMPLGDSITDGANVPGGYRIKLWKKFGSSTGKVDYLGSLNNGPVDLGDTNHEGHGGWTIANTPGRSGLTESMPTFLSSGVNPDVILLMIGTNDINLNYQVSTAPARLSNLISIISNKTTGLRPNAKLIVGSIAPIDDIHNVYATDWSGNSRAIAYNAAIPGIVANHQALGENVYFCDINAALALSDIADGLHPTAAGYDKIGDAWYSAIQSVVPEPATISLLLVGASLALVRRPRR